MTNTVRMVRIELRLLLVDPYPVVLLVAMPLVLIAFLAAGLVGGPGQSVPGILVLFAFIGLYNVGLVFFRDHGWRTWGRLRTSPIRPWEIVAGKTLPLSALYLVQAVVLLVAGYYVFGMPMRGSIGTLAVVVVVVAAAMTGIGLVLITFCRTMNQVTAVTNLGGVVLAGLGGALAPVDALPEWAQRIAPLSPVYWALDALRGVIDGGESLSDVAKPLAVLLGVTVVCVVVAVARFRVGDEKEYYA
jgi:ABC-2 type transport system permease protein